MTALLLCLTFAADPTIQLKAGSLERLREQEIGRIRRDFGRYPERADELRAEMESVRARRGLYTPILRAPYERNEWGRLPFQMQVRERVGDVTIVTKADNEQARFAISGPELHLAGPDSDSQRAAIDNNRIYVYLGTYKHRDEVSTREIPLFSQAVLRAPYHPCCQPRRHLLLQVATLR